MARAPRASKRSPKQIAAARAWAAAGRAAQQRKHAKPTAAQHQAALKWAAAGRAARQAKKAGGKAVVAKLPAVRAAVMPEEVVLPGADWPLGCNDVAPTCSAVAVAAHLRAATGRTMRETDILALHQIAGGESGASIESVLECLRSKPYVFATALGGMRLRHFFRTDDQCIVAGLVVGIRLGHEGHAVVSAPGGMISWGRFMPWDGEPEEAWALEWGIG